MIYKAKQTDAYAEMSFANGDTKVNFVPSFAAQCCSFCTPLKRARLKNIWTAWPLMRNPNLQKMLKQRLVKLADFSHFTPLHCDRCFSCIFANNLLFVLRNLRTALAWDGTRFALKKQAQKKDHFSWTSHSSQNGTFLFFLQSALFTACLYHRFILNTHFFCYWQTCVLASLVKSLGPQQPLPALTRWRSSNSTLFSISGFFTTVLHIKKAVQIAEFSQTFSKFKRKFVEFCAVVRVMSTIDKDTPIQSKKQKLFQKQIAVQEKKTKRTKFPTTA